MISSLLMTIRGLVAPEHHLSCATSVWVEGMAELERRGGGRRESGAFLLGTTDRDKRRVERFIYYDDLDPCCLDTGIVVFNGAGYGPLWELCRETSLSVVADVHTHPGVPFQSPADRIHPMVALSGHIALIVPNFAAKSIRPRDLGIYEYQGAHCWRNHSGRQANRYFYIGFWG